MHRGSGLRQSPCGWRRAAVPDGGVKPRENRPVSTTSSSPGRAEDAPTAWHEMAPTWFLRNVRHVCDRPLVRSGRYRETVRSETAMPRFSHSPWMRGAPQRQVSVRRRRMRFRTSDSMRGLPGRRRERALHHPGNPRRCHRATVAGWTNTSASRHRGHTLRRHIQNKRSEGRKRRSERERTPSWWRRARISRRRSLRVHRAERSTATVRNAYRMGRRMAGSSAHVNDFLLGRDNGEGQRSAHSRQRVVPCHVNLDDVRCRA